MQAFRIILRHLSSSEETGLINPSEQPGLDLNRVAIFKNKGQLIIDNNAEQFFAKIDFDIEKANEKLKKTDDKINQEYDDTQNNLLIRATIN